MKDNPLPQAGEGRRKSIAPLWKTPSRLSLAPAPEISFFECYFTLE
ncbi:hypothetical protein COXBURSA331_A0647 [Coxiella burnetii RSA 331]|nr:hypothetical protein COXBURSA331_A0647 [Coxiella burnetii RSA 331]EDR35282.1 hypothetical protein COXBURSA334_1500 [Coxiella burnetii Q321]